MRFRIIGISTLLALIVAGVSVYKFQAISDWLALYNYAPSSQVVTLADQTTMQDGTRRVFYVNHPSIDSKAVFNEHCPKNAEKTIVLGCFTPPKGIYLLGVNDSRLNGVVQVTASHEVLHAEYERLSGGEKARVNAMIEEAYKDVKDERIKSAVEAYKKSGADVNNELHSILATEVDKLPQDLEEYYSRYFKDRKKVIAYYASYEQAFKDLKSQVDQDDKKLASLKSIIESNQKRIETGGQEIDAERKKMDSLLSSKKIDEYNEAVPDFNQKVKDHNSLVAGTKSLIQEYNKLVEQRNNIAVQQQHLFEAIDSSKLTDK